MGVATVYVIVGAYIVGLLMTGWSDGRDWPLGLSVGLMVMAGLGAIAALIMPRLWRMGPRTGVWLLAGLVGMGAGWYLQSRSPSYEALMQPIPPHQQPTFPVQVQVEGRILDAPQLSRSQRVRFTLDVNHIQIKEPENSATSSLGLDAIAHHIYVTVPLLHGTGLYSGEAVKLEGQLYRPQAAAIPGAFDFQKYLERQGIFTGLNGKLLQVSHYQPTIRLSQPSSWVEMGRSIQQTTGRIRQRIIQSFVRGLDSPAGPLLAGMVLGRKAVDLPYETSDQFIQAGLAHILAASGFHVSLLLGLVLTIGQSLSPQKRLWLGSLTLLGYVSLTGLQPSVCRAALMGLAVLVAAVQERKLKPVGALVIIAAVLLLVNPQWIWDLGFQLSFLATLGLVVTVPWISDRLDWLPPAVAGAIAVPIAAMIWTLPILLRTMGTILPYSPILSVVTTPLIILISLGGMVTGAIAIVAPMVGSLAASLLYWPIQALMAMVEGFNHLPGQAIALGTISVPQLLLIYGLYAFILVSGSGQLPFLVLRRPMFRWSASLALIMVLAIPIGYGRFHRVQITALLPNHGSAPLMVVQNRGTIGLINSGSLEDIQYKLLPFLRHQGINQIDWAIATQGPDSDAAAWYQLIHTVPLSHLYHLDAPTPTTTASEAIAEDKATPLPISVQPLVTPLKNIGKNAELTLVSTDPPILQLILDGRVWLIISDKQVSLVANSSSNAVIANNQQNSGGVDVRSLPSSDVWYWPGLGITPALEPLLVSDGPRQAILTTMDAAAALSTKLTIPVYGADVNGAIQWQGSSGFAIAPDTAISSEQF